MQTHQTLLFALQTEQCQPLCLVTFEHLGASTSRATDLPSVAGTQLNIVHLSTDRDVAQRHRITDLNILALDATGYDLLADLQAGRAKNIGVAIGTDLTRHSATLFAVAYEGDKGGAVGIVFNALDDGRDGVPGGAFEVDNAVEAFVSAALMANGDAAGDGTAAGLLGEADGESGMGAAFVQA